MSYIDLPNEFPVVEQISRKYNRLPASVKRPHSRFQNHHSDLLWICATDYLKINNILNEHSLTADQYTFNLSLGNYPYSLYYT